jgi:hypothetical protein
MLITAGVALLPACSSEDSPLAPDALEQVAAIDSRF